MWQPTNADVRVLCEAVMENHIGQRSSTGADYCTHCGWTYGNVTDMLIIPHNVNCPVIIARDVMTRIDEGDV